MQKLHHFYANLAELIFTTRSYVLDIGSYRRSDGSGDPPPESLEKKYSHVFFSMEAAKEPIGKDKT